METEYYALWYRLDGIDKYLIWYTNDKDGIVLRKGRILVFSGQDSLSGYAAAHGIPITPEELKLHDLDVIVKWVKAPSPEIIDCDSFNAAWNLFADVSTTADQDFDKEKLRTKKVYEKLFWGMNLPSVTPEEKEYKPIWTKTEVKILQKVMIEGLKLFKMMISDEY